MNIEPRNNDATHKLAETERWVLLWSMNQNCLHVEPEAVTLRKNRERFASGQPGDYVTMFVGDRAEIDAAADALRATIVARDRQRALLRDNPAHLRAV